MDPNHVLIVYGSLAPGKENHHVISHIEGEWKKALIAGVLEDRGWGAGLGYPGFIPKENENSILVDIFISTELPKYWPEIDEFEGDEYQRIVIPFKMEDGTKDKGSIYALLTEKWSS